VPPGAPLQRNCLLACVCRPITPQPPAAQAAHLQRGRLLVHLPRRPQRGVPRHVQRAQLRQLRQLAQRPGPPRERCVLQLELTEGAQRQQRRQRRHGAGGRHQRLQADAGEHGVVPGVGVRQLDARQAGAAARELLEGVCRARQLQGLLHRYPQRHDRNLDPVAAHQAHRREVALRQVQADGGEHVLRQLRPGRRPGGRGRGLRVRGRRIRAG
jgi:hypothetical protein